MTRRFALRDLVDDCPQDGVFRVARALFRDPALFDVVPTMLDIYGV